MTSPYIDGLVQGCCNSRALAMELLRYCTTPSIYRPTFSQSNHVVNVAICSSKVLHMKTFSVRNVLICLGLRLQRERSSDSIINISIENSCQCIFQYWLLYWSCVVPPQSIITVAPIMCWWKILFRFPFAYPILLMDISVLNGVLWDMGQVHCGICEIGLLHRIIWSTLTWAATGLFGIGSSRRGIVGK